MRRTLFTILITGLIVSGTIQRAVACPFCTSVSQTFSEEIASMQVVGMARLVEAPDVPESAATDPDAPLPKAKFQISHVIKGEEWIHDGDTIEVLFFGEAIKDRFYLVMGTDAPNIMWTTPLGLSDRGHDYVMNLTGLTDDSKRLEFFQEYLEDDDEMLARDAYDEFAKAPYAWVVELKGKMHRDRLLKWVQDKEISSTRRRLYFTMLGVCGKPEDAELLGNMMRSDDRRMKAGLDALLACYLILKGQEGLNEVEELFLKNPDAEYADTYAAIMAIRFHGNETDVIPKTELVKALRHLLERPELADLVIPDLARWQDWEVMPRLVALFKNADEKSSWVRVPVINYLRSCPLEEAKRQIEELSEIDPDAVKRAQTFFPFDTEGDGGAASEADPNASSQFVPDPAPLVQPRRVTSGTVQTLPTARAMASNTTPDRLALGGPSTAIAQSDTPSHAGTTQKSMALAAADWQPNRAVLWGVPIASGIVFLYLLQIILGVPLTGRGK